jgi:hypothetical protein
MQLQVVIIRRSRVGRLAAGGCEGRILVGGTCRSIGRKRTSTQTPDAIAASDASFACRSSRKIHRQACDSLIYSPLSPPKLPIAPTQLLSVSRRNHGTSSPCHWSLSKLAPSPIALLFLPRRSHHITLRTPTSPLDRRPHSHRTQHPRPKCPPPQNRHQVHQRSPHLPPQRAGRQDRRPDLQQTQHPHAVIHRRRRSSSRRASHVLEER